MNEIWKFELKQSYQEVEMPVGANLLSVDQQKEIICLWAEVDPDAKREFRSFEIFGTGHSIKPGQRKFLGTVLTRGGELVWHVFERLCSPSVDEDGWVSCQKPPNEVWVEVKRGESSLVAMSIYGRDGVSPHWKSKGGSCYHPSAFSAWRHLPKGRLEELTEEISQWPKSHQNLLDDCLNPEVPRRTPFPGKR